jgi:LuxR family quorum sensing-dependent transcriptional regulator
MIDEAMRLADAALQAETPEAASTRFFEAVHKIGATYLQTRLYRRPDTRLTSRTHWAAGGFIKRIAPPAWPGSAAFNYVCFECNPLLGAIRQSRTRYRFSDFAPHADPTFREYWDALGEADIGEAACATSYGSVGTIASLHLGFAGRDIAPETVRAAQLAGLMLTERLVDFRDWEDDDLPALSSRERDCLSYTADGLRDREIAALLAISETTVRFHIDNARKKLGAANRVQAIAKLARLGLL